MSVPRSAVLGKSPCHRKRPRRSRDLSPGGGVQELAATAASSSPAHRSALRSALTSKSGVGSRGALDNLGLLQFNKITKQPQATRLPDVDVPVRPRVSAHADRERRADPWGAAYGPRPPRRQVCEYPDSLVTVRNARVEPVFWDRTKEGKQQSTFTIRFCCCCTF